MMTKRCASLIAAAILCLLSYAAPLDAAPAKETWTSVRSKNFLLIGNGSEKDIRKVATRLEQFRYVFAQLFPQAKVNSPIPTTVVVFKSDGSYKPFKPLYQGKPANVAGYFQHGEDVNYITLTTELGASDPYSVIFHEYVHLLVDNTLGDVPVWFNEGLAEYYSTFDVSDGDRRVTLGKPIAHHVYLLRERFMNLADLLRVGHDSPAYNERDKQGVFYAESWAFVHYLLQGNKGQRVEQLGRFSALLHAGKPLEESFQEAFQTDFKTMEKQLQGYVQRSAYPGTFYTQDKPLEFDAEMQSAPLTEAETQASLGDLLLHTNRLEDADAHLQQALSLAPALAAAHASLGMVRVRQNRLDDARQELRQAVAANSQNYLAHYYYAEALSGVRDGGLITGYSTEAAQTMRAELKKAMELAPTFPESYRLLAFVDLVTGEQLVEASALLLRAMKLKPGRLDYAFILGQVYLRRQQFAAARKILEPVVNSSAAEPRLRAEAKAMLDTVNNVEAQMAQYKAARERAAKETSGTETEDSTTQNMSSSSSSSSGVSPNNSSQRNDVRLDAPQGPRLRRRADGEQVRGMLTRVECTGGASVVLYVKANERMYKIHADALDQVQFVTFVKGVGESITCGPRQPENEVIVTFRTDTQPRALKYDGEAVAVEFVSKEIKGEQ